jgi:hypothetical protein
VARFFGAKNIFYPAVRGNHDFRQRTPAALNAPCLVARIAYLSDQDRPVTTRARVPPQKRSIRSMGWPCF